jgi:hypothetical protein
LNGEPAAIIEQPRSRLVLRDGLGEEWTVAWVKLSTAFKPHIKELRGAPLAVWLYLSLSINKSGVAFPSINRIAEDTGYSRNGVMEATKELEEKGYLKVRRGERKFNLYEPEFSAIGRMNEPSNESTKWTGQADESTFPADESTFSPNESSAVDLNKRNKSKLELRGIENKIFAGLPVTEDDLLDEKLKGEATAMFERAFGITKSWPWWSDKVWTEFSKWVVERYKEDRFAFGNYIIWRATPYVKGAMSNVQIRRDPELFSDSWDMFKQKQSQVEMVELL